MRALTNEEVVGENDVAENRDKVVNVEKPHELELVLRGDLIFRLYLVCLALSLLRLKKAQFRKYYLSFF